MDHPPGVGASAARIELTAASQMQPPKKKIPDDGLTEEMWQETED